MWIVYLSKYAVYSKQNIVIAYRTILEMTNTWNFNMGTV